MSAKKTTRKEKAYLAFGIIPASYMKKMDKYTINNLSAYTINNLSAYTINNLSAYTINNLSADTIKNLSADTINNLSADTINNLSAYTINNLSADTIKNLSADTLSAFTEIKKLIDDLPVLDRPYTTLLKDIKAKKRLHQQSTFGDIHCFDPSTNICGSPMCTAGHLVNMAGAPGYALKNKLEFARAAEIIHFKAHPDFPCQNFGSIDQDLALAYIEEMAEMEAIQECKKS